MLRGKDAIHQRECPLTVAVVAVRIAVLTHLLDRLCISILDLTALCRPCIRTCLLLCAQLLACTRLRLTCICFMNKRNKLRPRPLLCKKVHEQLVHARIAAERRAAVPRKGKPPVLHPIIVMKGACKCTRDEIGVLGAVVVLLICPCNREERRPVDADRLAVSDRHMPRTVVRHELRELHLAPLRRGMVGEIVLRQILLRRILILRKLLRHIGQIIAHARHRRRPAAGVEARTRHDTEAALIRLILRGQGDILRDRVPHERIELVPVHESEVHIEEAHAVELRRRLRIVVCAVLADTVRHLVPEHGGELVHIAVQPADEPAVDRHIVRRIARGVEDRAVRNCPRKGQRVHAQHIVAVTHKALHDPVHELDVARIPRAPVLCNVLPLTLHLCTHIIAECKHRAERRMICTEHAECLRRNPPRVNRLRARRREEYAPRDHKRCEQRACCFAHHYCLTYVWRKRALSRSLRAMQ